MDHLNASQSNSKLSLIITFTLRSTRFPALRIPGVISISAQSASNDFLRSSSLGIGNQKSAPIYVHTGSQLKSTIVPGDLEIPNLTNIHQVWPHIINTENGSKQLYILVHGWNKGKYAVLKLEK